VKCWKRSRRGAGEGGCADELRRMEESLRATLTHLQDFSKDPLEDDESKNKSRVIGFFKIKLVDKNKITPNMVVVI
jgi:hypothetical protein